MSSNQRSTRNQGVRAEDLQAEDRFSASLAALAGILGAPSTNSERRIAGDRRERQSDGEAAA